jgi:hypothetical protein
MPRLSTPRILPTSMRTARSRLLGGRQLGADERARRLHPGAHVRRAADDRERLASADVDRADAQPIGVRMRLDRSTLATTTPRNGGARRASPRPRGRPSSAARQLDGADRRIAELAQPGLGNCIAASGELAEEPQVAVEEETRSSMP